MKKLYFVLLIILFTYTNVFPQSKGIITGIVIDESTNEPLPGVNVRISGTTLGAATNLVGKFSIPNLIPGTYQLEISAIGYESVIKADIIVNNARPSDVMIKLSSSAIQLDGITIRSDYFSKDPSEIGSIRNLSYEEIRRAPGGFEDVVRALSILPGVAQASPGRNDLVVRGGAPSENLYVVDGFVVPNINHFGNQGATGGPISFVNLDFVRETSFSTGGFSALYGDKLSSVLTIDLRDGRTDRLGGKGTISASQFGLNLEGPLSDKGNFIFSVRRSYLDFIFNAAGFNFVPEYYDALGKFTYNIDQKTKISYLFIGAFDRVKFNNNNAEDRYDNSRILGSNQNSYLTGISYRKLLGNGFYTVTLGRNFTDYDSSQRDSLLIPIFLNKSREQENELKGDLVLKTSENGELNFGISAKFINFSADVKLPTFKTTFGENLSVAGVNTKTNYTKYNSYLHYSNSAFKRIRYSAGLRADYFDGINTKFYLSPRFSLSYVISDLANINISTGVYHQSPSYIWLAAIPSNQNLKAVQVNQFVLGYERKLREDVQIKMEGFIKNYSDYPTSTLRPYLVLANTGAGYGGGEENFSSFGFEPLISAGKGKVKGIEFSIQKKSSDIPHYGILSITYSEAKFTGLDGVERFGTYDQRWIINLTGGYMFNKEWEVSFRFRFATGNPYTQYNNDGTQSVANYNTSRFDPFHSLDLRVDKRWEFDNWALITYLDLQNVYNNKYSNSLRWDARKGYAENQSSIGLLPSIGVSAEF